MNPPKKRTKPPTDTEHKHKRPRPKPRVCTINKLPVEVLIQIAGHILGPLRLVNPQFSPQYEPYAPRRKHLTTGWKPRGNRFGAVPQGVYDLLNFASTCRAVHAALGQHLELVGGSTKVVVVKEEKDKEAGSSTQPDATAEKVAGRKDHRGPTGDELFRPLFDHRETLKEVVIHSCGDHDGNMVKTSRHEVEPTATGLSRTAPFQSIVKDGAPLPKLVSLQLGPDLCVSCMQDCLRLFTETAFYLNGTAWDHSRPFFLSTDRFKEAPAPSLKSIQLLMPEIVALDVRVSEPERVAQLFQCISTDVRAQIQTLSLVLRGQLDRRWGGFGVTGTTSKVAAKSKAEVEAVLRERIREAQQLPSTVALRKAKAEKEKEAIARYDAVRAARVKSTNPVDGALDAAAMAAISTILPDKTVDVKPKVKPNPDVATAHQLQTVGNHQRMDQQFRTILELIAETVPNLAALQVVRSGASRNDLVEGTGPIERMADVYLRPLRNLSSLEHLDLGLAIVGRREVRDFPLGMSFAPVDIKGMKPAEARVMLLRNRVHADEVRRAVKEGDAWRKKVIERLVLGKPDPEADEPDTPSATPSVAGSFASPTPGLPRWPANVRSGYIYSPDLLDRARFKGFLMRWEKDVVGGHEVVKWSRETVLL